MVQSIQKLITIGSSVGVTLPAKEIKRQNLKVGDEVEVIIRPIAKANNKSDEQIIQAAKKILKYYRQDFKNLSQR